MASASCSTSSCKGAATTAACAAASPAPASCRASTNSWRRAGSRPTRRSSAELNGRAPVAAQLFFDRFRAEVTRYADGVHRLGDPAPAAAVKGLPAELASFLRSWNGVELFVDAFTIYDAAHVRREGELMVFGETGQGDRLALDA